MLEFIKNLSAKEMDAFTTQHELCNLLQSSSWAAIKTNWDNLNVGVKKNGKLVASAMILIKKLPLGFTLFYIPRGPIMDYCDEEVVRFMLENLVKTAKKYHCLYIKFDPAIIKNEYMAFEYNEDIFEQCQIALTNLTNSKALHLGFSKDIAATIQPRFNANVYPVDNYEETLPKHTRKFIKTAQKNKVNVNIYGIERVDDFARVVEMTEQRKNINLRNAQYFRQLMQVYQEDAFIYLAEVNLKQLVDEKKAELEDVEKQLSEVAENQKKKRFTLEEKLASVKKDYEEFSSIYAKTNEDVSVIAGCLSIKFGNTVEMLYAGMDERFRKFMPQYEIYVKHMQDGFKANAISRLGGVEGTLDDGLTKFKSNFNALIDEYIGEFDLPVNKMLYHASQYAFKIRKRMKAKR